MTYIRYEEKVVIYHNKLHIGSNTLSSKKRITHKCYGLCLFLDYIYNV